MYKIEWKKSGANSLNSLFIDGKEYSNDCLKFALRCNDLEQLLQDIYEILPSPEYDDLLSNPKITAQINQSQKWMPEREAINILGSKNLKYFITNGELGFSMIGDIKVFDQWDVIQVQKLIINKE